MYVVVLIQVVFYITIIFFFSNSCFCWLTLSVIALFIVHLKINVENFQLARRGARRLSIIASACARMVTF